MGSPGKFLSFPAKGWSHELIQMQFAPHVLDSACGGELSLCLNAQSISSQGRSLLTRSYLKNSTFLIPQTMAGASVLGSGSSLAEAEAYDKLFLVGLPSIHVSEHDLHQLAGQQ